MKNFLPSLTFGIAILGSVLILSNTYRNRFDSTNSISVTGQGKRDFKSDLIVWSGRFTQKNLVLKDAYKSLQEDQERIKEYLAEKGVSAEEMVFSSVDIDKEFDYRYDDEGKRYEDFSGYRLSQRVEIESKEKIRAREVAGEGKGKKALLPSCLPV